jgi:hypothetical protein
MLRAREGYERRGGGEAGEHRRHRVRSERAVLPVVDARSSRKGASQSQIDPKDLFVDLLGAQGRVARGARAEQSAQDELPAADAAGLWGARSASRAGNRCASAQRPPRLRSVVAVFPSVCVDKTRGRTRCSSIARIAVLAPAQVGGRNILGYVQAQRAVTDATYCVQRWPALKLEAGTYSAPSPRANSASFPLCSPRLARATHSDLRPSRHAFGMHSGQHRQEH